MKIKGIECSFGRLLSAAAVLTLTTLSNARTVSCSFSRSIFRSLVKLITHKEEGCAYTVFFHSSVIFHPIASSITAYFMTVIKNNTKRIPFCYSHCKHFQFNFIYSILNFYFTTFREVLQSNKTNTFYHIAYMCVSRTISKATKYLIQN